MPVPTHRDDCQTLMYKIKCPDCNDEVFYFSCSCGSKVLFDNDYSPWIPHERRCWRYLIRMCIEVFDIAEDNIFSMIERYAYETDQSIPLDVQSEINRLKGGKKTGKLRIAEISATNEKRNVLGTLRVINNNINFFKKFKIENNYIGRMLLGRLVKESFMEITVREGRRDDNTCSEFIAYIPMKEIRDKLIRLNSLISVELCPHQIADGRFIWLAQNIKEL